MFKWLLKLLDLDDEELSKKLLPERTARAAFEKQYPEEQIGWTRFVADEPDRFIVGIFYGCTRPPRYKFYAIDKQSMNAKELIEDKEYRPKNWR